MTSKQEVLPPPPPPPLPKIDSVVVPPSLVQIAPILRVANEVEPSNPRVAFIYSTILLTRLLVFSLRSFKMTQAVESEEEVTIHVEEIKLPFALSWMLWVDKYRPKTLDKVLVHEDVAQNLKKLVTEQDCPHLLFYGPSGSGKKTLIMALLRQMFGASAEKVKVENKNWKVDAGSRTIDLELTTLSSTHHVELNPSDAGFQDRYIVQEIIKEMAKNRPIDTKGKKGFKEDQIVKVLEFIGKKEGLQLPPGFAARIAEKSGRSLRRAILSFETCRVQQYPFINNQVIPPMDWEEYVSEIASDIMKEQSPKRLFQVRGKLYELLVNCIPPEIILKRLLYELLKKLDFELKHDVCHWAAYYEHRMHLGQKAIFHIEAFVAKFMSIYKGFLIATFG
ncbi:hypothetical protein L1987_25407 [Smallanthus sonchifolius]|uniref:Uncharacterized protein n=1 Tax=Smallanthus sonchifolius TaxID=185202 RepID=A0ACB9INB9_9ASTR|nr:hypothetical protein L1987_25407 [Smallanthus sonchifolius]